MQKDEKTPREKTTKLKSQKASFLHGVFSSFRAKISSLPLAWRVSSFRMALFRLFTFFFFFFVFSFFLCVLNFTIFFLLKRNVLGGNQVRFKYKIYEIYKSLIAFIYFLYTLLAFKKFTLMGHRHSSVFVTGNWTRNGRRQFQRIFCCCLLHLGDISGKVIHASYDTLIYIFNLACQILPRPLC